MHVVKSSFLPNISRYCFTPDMRRLVHREFWRNNTEIVRSFFLLSLMTIWVSLEAQPSCQLSNFFWSMSHRQPIGWTWPTGGFLCLPLRGVNDHPNLHNSPSNTCHDPNGSRSRSHLGQSVAVTRHWGEEQSIRSVRTCTESHEILNAHKTPQHY